MNTSNNSLQTVISQNKDNWLNLRSEKCFNCQQDFQLSFSFKRQGYSTKNFLSYWSEDEKDREKYVCSPCLRDLYFNQRPKLFSIIKSLKKRNHLTSYISRKII